VGVDSHIWGLNMLAARQGALRRAGLADGLVSTQLDADDYWFGMQQPNRAGFLARHTGDGDETVATQLASLTRRLEPQRWASTSEPELIELLDAEAVADELQSHARSMVEIQRGMYAEAMADDGTPAMPGMPRVTLFRVKPHLDRLEIAMERHVQWFGGAGSTGVTGSSRAGPAKGQKPLPAGAARGGSGFGAGSNAPSKKAKGAKGRKKK